MQAYRGISIYRIELSKKWSVALYGEVVDIWEGSYLLPTYSGSVNYRWEHSVATLVGAPGHRQTCGRRTETARAQLTPGGGELLDIEPCWRALWESDGLRLLVTKLRRFK
jgi:hypothetical protein